MARKGTRRMFMKDCTTSAAALAALSAAPGAADATDGAREGTPYLCVTCGTQFAESNQPPARCPICEDERQYVHPDGQKWTTLEDLRASHRNVIKKEEDRLYSINTEPKFGIGQRAFLVQAEGGNVLWDCVGLLDDATIQKVKELGGIAEIAISHPHYYTSMVEWSRAFGGAPIHLHEAERPWVMRPDPCIRFWKGRELELRGGLKLVSTGGHFEGYQVLHWPAAAGGRGALDGRRPAADLHGPEAGHVHVQLSELHPAQRHADPPHRGMPRALAVRPDLRGILHPGQGDRPYPGQGGRPPLG